MNLNRLKRGVLATLGAATLLLPAAHAGTYVNNFTDPTPTGLTLNGGVRDDQVTPYPAIEGGKLALVYAENSKQGTVILDDLDGEEAIEAFTMNFKLRIGGGSSTPADGMAIHLGQLFGSENFGEEGPLGANGLTIAFDIYDNGGGEAPSIDLKVNDVVVAAFPRTIFEIVSDAFTDVSIQLKKNGTLTMSYKGQVVHNDVYLPGYAPAAGDRFAIGARTGGLNANHWIDDLNITTVRAVAAAPSFLTPPAAVTVNERGTATFRVVADGSAPFSFQWLSNNVEIAEATSPVYTLANAGTSANGAAFKVRVTNAAGTATSADAVLTVTSDTTKPTLASVRGTESLNEVVVTFSEPITPETLNASGNYALSGGLTFTLEPINDRSVRLLTSPQTAGTQYTLTVNNMVDTAATPNTIDANSTANFRAFVLSRGFLKFEHWANIGGVAVQNLLDSEHYLLDPPDTSGFITAFNSRTIFPDDSHENYGARISGFLIPAVSGDYRFFIHSDDGGELALSTDSSRDNLVVIATEPGCCNNFSEPTGHTRTSEPISLVAGTAYAVQAFVKEGGGGDYIRIAWRLEGDTTPASALEPIPGSFLATYANPDAASINFSQSPSTRTAAENTRTTFTAAATGSPAPLTFQWQRKAAGAGSFSDIPGATGTSYQTPVLKQSTDDGAVYRVLARVPGAEVPSAEATLTVIIDSTPPQVVSAVGGENQKSVTLTFSEALIASGATTAGNYTIAGLTVSAATLKGDSTVILTTSQQTAGTTYTVTVSNVKDSAGNNVDPVANTAQFVAKAIQVGVLKFEAYWGPGGTAVNDLLNSAKYPGSPDLTMLLANFNSGDALGDNFGARMSGFIIPQETGDYRFFLNSDDSSALWLSTDDSVANLSANPIAFEPGCCNAFSEPGDHPRTSEPISLVAGQKYYVVYAFKEGGGGDYGRVAWRLESDFTPANELPPIPGRFLAAAMDPAQLNGFILSGGTALGSGTGSGFKARVHQVDQTGSNALNNHVSRAEQQLAGAVAPNVVDPTGSEGGIWTIETFINWNQEMGANGTFAEAGSFTSANDPSRTDEPIPGIPGLGTASHNTDSIAGELVTYVEFPTAGVYYMGVNSDDGFAVTGSDQPPANNGAVKVSSPASVAGSYAAVLPGVDGTSFPRISAPITGKLVYATPADGCTPLTNPDAIRGNIALIDRAVCTFALKAQLAKDAGAIAVIIANSRDVGSAEGHFPVVMGGGIDFPAVMISKPHAAILKAALAENVMVSITPDSTPLLGQFNSGRGASDTIFPVVVPAPGVYPLRTVWFEGGGGANLEWFSVTSTGEKILLNDRENPAALKAFSGRVGGGPTPTISIAKNQTGVVITFTGRLYSSDTVDGVYTVVPGTGSVTVPATSGNKFYRSGP